MSTCTLPKSSRHARECVALRKTGDARDRIPLQGCSALDETTRCAARDAGEPKRVATAGFLPLAIDGLRFKRDHRGWR